MVLLAALARFYRLDASDPWLDEFWSYLVSAPPLPEVIRLIAEDNNSPLYYILLHGVIATSGANWGMLRLPSAMASILTLLPVGALAFRTGGRRAALAAVALFAVHPISVFYAQTARVYALQTLLLAVTAYLCLGLRRWWWGVPFALAMYAHPLAIMVIPGLWAGALCVRASDRRPALRMLAAGSAVAFVLFLPWLRITLEQSGRSVTDYLGEIWARTSLWIVPFRSLGITLGVDALPPNVLYPRIAAAYPAFLHAGVGHIVVHLVILAVLSLVVVAATQSLRARQVAVALGITLGVHILLSEFVRPVLLLGRHDSPYVALLVPLTATALAGDALKGRPARAYGGVLLAAVLLLSGWWTVRYHLSPPYRHQPTQATATTNAIHKPPD